MGNILIALLLMLPIALVACIALVVLNYFFGVEDDHKKAKIRECLPGINCGACGFRGCDDYAQAVASGNAKTNLCIPGAQKTAKLITKIVGGKEEYFDDVVAFVGCNGNCEATSINALYEGVQSCSGAAMLYGGGKSCAYGCLGFGDCANVCPADAICTIDGIAHIDSSKCLGCGLCANVCPKKLISMIPQNAVSAVMCHNKQKGADARKACKNACIACKKCERNCPQGAITLINNCAVIDYNKCEHCGLCANECPTGCIKEVSLTNLLENNE